MNDPYQVLNIPSTATDEASSELLGSVIRMTCSDFGAATDFEIPAEALEAEDVTQAAQSDGSTQDTGADQNSLRVVVPVEVGLDGINQLFYLVSDPGLTGDTGDCKILADHNFP